MENNLKKETKQQKPGGVLIPVEHNVERAISCDQVAWLLAIANRYLPMNGHPGISQKREMMKYGMLYEIMEIAHLSFADDNARWNGTPSQVRKYPAGK